LSGEAAGFYNPSMFTASPAFARAALEYRWLLDRGYSEQAALKLVGDHHQLGRDERMVLFRGVASGPSSRARSALVAGPSSIGAGLEILVDGYNQALTVMHYLAGRPLFVGTDSLTRDAGAAHGRIADKALFERSVGLLADRLEALSPERVAVYLDSPVPGSAGHAALFRRALEERGVEAIALLERSADAPLKAAAPLPGVLVASGDSAIADALASAHAAAIARAAGPRVAAESVGGARIYDAARWAIEMAFGPVELLDLGRLVEGPKEDL
jgi:hypothetical protein